MAANRPHRRIPATSPLDALCMAYADAPADTFSNAVGDALLAAIVDLSQRVDAQHARIRDLEAQLAGLEERLDVAADMLAPQRRG